MMNDPPGARQAGSDPVGLCRDCAHARIIRNDRGSTFYLCRLSIADPRFARYPRLPVTACKGFLRLEHDDD
jgi:hypothetical protein